MKVYIGKYRYHWVSPYTILEKVFFWREIDYDEPIIERLSNILEPFIMALMKFLDFVHPKINYVKIDKWDTWSMDHTLSFIILPMLKQLKLTKHGAPFTDDEDVPEELRSTSAPAKENEWDTDDNHFKRWDYILDQMIWSFEQEILDEEPDFWAEKPEGMYFEKCENSDLSQMKYLKEGVFDHESYKIYHDRKQNGFRLFGKYYSHLWD